VYYLSYSILRNLGEQTDRHNKMYFLLDLLLYFIDLKKIYFMIFFKEFMISLSVKNQKWNLCARNSVKVFNYSIFIFSLSSKSIIWSKCFLILWLMSLLYKKLALTNWFHNILKITFRALDIFFYWSLFKLVI
jgi:hypothetical protein